ncbi:MAG TPA: zf-HC2 domain-containing protein [Pyrinomonadaceae bacterium]|jgi:hypothetical protein|nr:zf-HC2 domain-containing protein [Pyrinomonadaceae bacterium]
MLNNGHKKCEFGEDIVAYLYGEMPAAGRVLFEKHLAMCHTCTDEFAAISDVRFSVFEWQRAEFAKLATPEIVIPYPAKSGVATTGLFDGLRGLLSLTTAVPVIATLLIVLGVGYIFFVRQSEPVPVAVQSPVEKPSVASPQPVAATPEIATVAPPANTKVEKATVKRTPAVPRPFVAKRVAPQVRLGNDVAVSLTPAARKAPVLSGYEDEDDTSLRLSDIFDELGAKRPD